MRDYDATLGSYIQADPLGLVDGASVYGYAFQNPARWSDPRGEFAVAIPIIGGVVIGWIDVAIVASAAAAAAAVDAIIDAINNTDDCNEKTDCSKASKHQLRAAGVEGKNSEHNFKREYVTGSVSHWDICACKDNSIVLRRVGQCGKSGATHETYARWK